MSQNSKEFRIDPFLHGKDKFKSKDHYSRMEEELKRASKTMSEGIERAKASRIDVVGQNGNTGDHYE